MPALDSAPSTSPHVDRPLLFHLGTAVLALPLLHLWHARGVPPALLTGLLSVLLLWAPSQLASLLRRPGYTPSPTVSRPGYLAPPLHAALLPARIAITSAGAALFVLAARAQGQTFHLALAVSVALVGWLLITRVTPTVMTALTVQRMLLLSALLGTVGLLCALPLTKEPAGPATGPALAAGLLGVALISAALDTASHAARPSSPSASRGAPWTTPVKNFLVLGVTLSAAVLCAHGMTTGQPTERFQDIALTVLAATVVAAWLHVSATPAVPDSTTDTNCPNADINETH